MRAGLQVFAVCAWVAATAVAPAIAGEFRDPMRPAGTAPASATRPAPARLLKLEGVIAGEKRVAILNGRLVRAGDVIAGARIVEILTQGVRYERAGKVDTLWLATAPVNTNVRVARSDEKP